ncbi:protein TolQ [Phenylobacterium montanum]|uniref:Protein TolQ n=1 Tax=Phenylobacterium montanum TaxID=2823693 RepID=A0A975FXP2_9CAUL|nr:protein TolQ [Caulobacter sp. S6]QUD87139.1 protein TolQ [Caulobacter sp. S6]
MDAVQSTLSSDNFSIISVFMRADWVVKGVMVGLVLASLWSWTVIIDKWFRFSALNKEADQFEDKVGSGRPLDDIAAEAGENPAGAMPRILQLAMRTWRESRRAAMDESQVAFLMQRIDRGMDIIVARESARVEAGLSSLAIVATASPFIGLFGTVWGIMHAFQSIAAQKNTSLAVVAPSIAEALFATAVGLAAAIPAYIFYNKFSADAGKFADRLGGFADELAAAIAKRLSERG